MAGELFDLFARQVCNVARVPKGEHSAEQLTYYVRQWPTPTNALSYMNFTYADVPIVFLDVSFKYMADWLLQLFKDGSAVFPVGLMPQQRVYDWEEDVQVQTFRGYLSNHNLGVQMIAEDNAVLCRGEWVHPCDFRPVFLSGYNFG